VASEDVLMGYRIEDLRDGTYGAIIAGDLLVDEDQRVVQFPSADDARSFVDDRARRDGVLDP
jgi:hypothetical protein